MLEARPPGSFRLCANSAFEPEALRAVRLLADRVPAGLGRLRPLALILTGSFARGEGTLTAGPQGETRWLSDIECLVLFADRWRGHKSEIRNTLGRAAAELESAARADGLKVQLSPMLGSRLARMRPAIFTYELLEHGKLLWGDPAAIAPPTRNGQDCRILRPDAFRLLNNRIVEQLAVRAGLLGDGSDPLEVGYALTKFWLDLGTSLSIFLDCYRTSYRDRQGLIEGALASSDALPPEVAQRLLVRLGRAIAVKLGKTTPQEMACEGSFGEAAAVAARVWNWESAQMLGVTQDGFDWRSIVDRLRRLESGPQRARDWARLFLRTGAVRSIGLSGVGSVLRAGSFGSAIYAAACLLFFFWDEVASGGSRGEEIAAALSGLLGKNTHRARACDRRWLAERAFRAWQLHLRDAAL